MYDLEALRHLPADLTPTALVSAIEAALPARAELSIAAEERAVIHVVGEGGGDFVVRVEGDRLRFGAGSDPAPALQVTVSVGDLSALAAGSVRDAVLARAPRLVLDVPAKAPPAAVRLRLDALRSVRGDLQLVIGEADGVQRKVTLTLGPATPRPEAPTATITVATSTLAAIAAGESTVPAAFFAGQIAMDGDLALVMDLVARLMPPPG